MRSKHFRIEELCSRELCSLVKTDILWSLFNPKLIETIDYIKEKFPEGSMTINNWMWNGSRNQSGLRTKDSKYYSSTSQHSMGNAIDCVFSDYDVDSIRQYIFNNPEEFPHIKGIELGVSWLHIDVRQRDNVLTFTAQVN